MINIKGLVSAVFKMIFLHSYYDVGECPYCGSPATGRILQIRFGMNAVEETVRYMEKGEFVRFINGHPTRTCYCNDCNGEWKGTSERRWVTSAELHRIIERKGLTDEYMTEFEILEKSRKRQSQSGVKVLRKIMSGILPFNDVAGMIQDTKNELIINPFNGLSEKDIKHTIEDDDTPAVTLDEITLIDTDALDGIWDEEFPADRPESYGSLTDDDEQFIRSILEENNG